MKKSYRFLIGLVLFFLLLCVRFYETTLFYDPFLVFFKKEYLYTALPEFNRFQLYTNLLFRYVLNTLLSIGLLYVVFQSKSHVKFAIKFYIGAFLLMIFLFFLLIEIDFYTGYLIPFYLRRFLIQPLFLPLLLAAFYYDTIVGTISSKE
ncbi:MAG: exosortase F system-associated membrane protein [Flavicella sp.]